jgi:hypothetical protein
LAWIETNRETIMRLATVIVALFVAGILPAALAAQDGSTVKIDGLSSKAPAAWKEVATTSQMRYKQFTVPAVGGDKMDAELIIFFFGPGQGGGADENIKRWKGMFQTADGRPAGDKAKVEKFTVGHVPVAYLDISGTYLFKARPFDEKATPRANHRMLAVVFESRNGPYFIRLVGPEKTVGEHKKGFDEWLKNFK